MIQHVFFFCYLIGTAALFAFVEIHAEGKNGWASNFPTWRIENKWTRLFYSERPLTGKEINMVISMAHYSDWVNIELLILSL